jgi:queuine tRNA-ribosyltransferase
MTFNVTHQDGGTKARIGILSTKKGKVETPFFMPVATRGVTKGISSEELHEIGAKAIISNSLIIYLRNGSKIAESFGGLGKFMNYNGINFTDSGGFQMYSPNIYIKSNDEGVFFRNPLNGDKMFITPEKDMEIQLEINSDVAMCLDSMPLYKHSKDEIEEAVRKTSLWARRCKIHHDNLQESKNKNERQLLFGIIQGGIYNDLREKSAKELINMNFDGYSIGGLGLGETHEEEFEVVDFLKKIIPENKPIYMMGIGDPVEILQAISKGIDIFDSRMPTQNARRGLLFTSNGKLRITNKQYEFDKTPIDENCNCKVCKNHSKAFIRYQLINDEPIGKSLATYHNLYFMQDLLRKAKEKIKENKFDDFLREFQERYKE